MPTSLGPAEILVILVVALIVLGPKKLPEAGRQVGRAIAEVRRWSQGFQDEIRTVIDPNVAPSYPPPASSGPPPPPPPALPGPSTPAEAEYTGPLPDAAPPLAVDPVDPVDPAGAAAGDDTATPVSSNGSAPGPATPEPSEPPAGDPPRT